VDVTGAVDEGADDSEALVDSGEGVSAEQVFPGVEVVVAVEVIGEGEFGLLGADADDGVVGMADVGGVGLEGEIEFVQGGEIHEAGQAFSDGVVVGDAVGLEVTFHLKAVFEAAEEVVGVAQVCGGGGVEEFVLDHFLEGGEGLRILEEGEVSTFKQLQGLDDELDFADTAAAEFDVTFEFTAPDDFGFDAVFHGGDFAEDLFGQEARVAEGLDHFLELAGECGIAGDAPGFDEHHAFPGLAPLGVVVLVAGEGSGEGAGVAFRAEAEVDPVEGAVGGKAGEFGDQVFDEALEELVTGDAASGSAGGGRFIEEVAFFGVDEEEVDVRAIVEFLAAEFSHAEDAEGRGEPLTVGRLVVGASEPAAEIVGEDALGGFDADVGQVGDFAQDVGQWAEAGEVAEGDAEGLALFKTAEMGERIGGGGRVGE